MMGIGGMIPTLIIVDLSKSSNSHIEVISKHGVEAVMDDPEATSFPWFPKPFKYLDGSALQRLERSPCFIVISKRKEVEKMIEKVAVEYRSSHPGDLVSFLFGSSEDYPLAQDLIKTTKSKTETMMVIVFAQRLKFVSAEEISEDAMKKILQNFDSKQLSFTQLIL
jgi:hypothetical protein